MKNHSPPIGASPSGVGVYMIMAESIDITVATPIRASPQVVGID